MSQGFSLIGPEVTLTICFVFEIFLKYTELAMLSLKDSKHISKKVTGLLLNFHKSSEFLEQKA